MRTFLGFVFIMVLIAGGLTVLKVGHTFSAVFQGRANGFLFGNKESFPIADPNERDRFDVLVLGIRGDNDPHGGLLTDSMILVSIDLKKNDVALISIPRDTYLTIPLVNKAGKINEAYGLGRELERDRGGLELAKRAAQEVTGVNIDNAIVVDFNAFKEIVDTLGGIEVNVEKPFRENLQWDTMDIVIPRGLNHMDSNTALLYVRSRFSTSDFDRTRRIQEVILAIKQKAITLGFLAQPAKLYRLLDTLGRHVKSDFETKEVAKVFELARKIEQAHGGVIRLSLNTQSGFLKESAIQGSYVLLPSDGNFAAIHDALRNIFLRK